MFGFIKVLYRNILKFIRHNKEIKNEDYVYKFKTRLISKGSNKKLTTVVDVYLCCYINNKMVSKRKIRTGLSVNQVFTRYGVIIN